MVFDKGKNLMHTTTMSIGDDLRDALARDKRSLAELARLARVDVSVLSRFVRHERGMNIETAGRLADLFGLELRPKARRKGGR